MSDEETCPDCGLPWETCPLAIEVRAAIDRDRGAPVDVLDVDELLRQIGGLDEDER